MTPGPVNRREVLAQVLAQFVGNLLQRFVGQLAHRRCVVGQRVVEPQLVIAQAQLFSARSGLASLWMCARNKGLSLAEPVITTLTPVVSTLTTTDRPGPCDLMGGSSHVGVGVSRVLQLDQHQRQAVNEQDDVRPARVVRPGDGTG
jgi:hypothetical protein